MTSKIRIAAVLLLLQCCFLAPAATLKPETKVAWEEYVQAATTAMQARLQPGAHFLWTDDVPGRIDRVRGEQPYIAPIGPHIPLRVPSGLIHDWLGAGFLPNVTIDEMLKVLQDYDHYKDIYKPGVAESSFRGTEEGKEHFYLRFVNKSAIAKTALDSTCESTSVRVDERHWYGISTCGHIREVDKFGTPGEHILPEDEGMGLIWRIFSITRLEERDGGVYAELEAMALSRDIPAAFRLIVTPIVRRVSRGSLETSLHQTKAALDKSMEKRAQSGGSH
jgi:hypothetical protein